MTNTFCTSGAVLLKAGTNVSTAFTTGTTPVGFATKEDAIDQLINQAESSINDETGVNYTDTYTTLNDDVKKILEDAASSHAAMGLTNFDLSIVSLAEGQTTLDFNNNRFERAMRLLREKKTTDFINGA